MACAFLEFQARNCCGPVIAALDWDPSLGFPEVILILILRTGSMEACSEDVTPLADLNLLKDPFLASEFCPPRWAFS